MALSIGEIKGSIPCGLRSTFMKYFITYNPQSKHGFQLVKVYDDNREEICNLDKKTTDDYLYLPEDVVKTTNRRLISMAMIKKANVERFEITAKEYREPRVLGPRNENSTPRKKLEEYLTDDEKSIIADLIAKAKARREADKPKPLTEKEKLQRQLAKLQEKLAKYKEN